MSRQPTAPSVAPTPRFAIADSVVRFLSASMAAGNGAATVAMKDATCPACGEATLLYRAQRRQAATTSKHRRELEVIVRCRSGTCVFHGITDGRFSLD